MEQFDLTSALLQTENWNADFGMYMTFHKSGVVQIGKDTDIVSYACYGDASGMFNKLVNMDIIFDCKSRLNTTNRLESYGQILFRSAEVSDMQKSNPCYLLEYEDNGDFSIRLGKYGSDGLSYLGRKVSIEAIYKPYEFNRVQIGFFNEENGVRALIYINGKLVINQLDENPSEENRQAGHLFFQNGANNIYLRGVDSDAELPSTHPVPVKQVGDIQTYDISKMEDFNFRSLITIMTARTHNDENGAVIPYRIYLPTNYSPDKKYPLAMYLHGSGLMGSDNLYQLAGDVNFHKAFLDYQSTEEFIYVVPQCVGPAWNENDYDRNHPESIFTVDVAGNEESKIGAAVYASSFLLLDSDTEKGGGTDQTAEVQEILDKAEEWGSLYFIMDGAALVSTLTIHSNTTIYCLDRNCGFFQKGGSNNSLLANSNMSFDTIYTENITLLGGTYNFNCLEQERYDCSLEEIGGGAVYAAIPEADRTPCFNAFCHANMGFKLCGVRNLTMKGVRTVDQRIYAMFIACFEHVLIEDQVVDLPNIMDGQNQDGLHFQGPGRDLVIKNIRGCSGDDFIALTPDEFDFESEIRDVLIDGVYVEDADQCVRLLSRHQGRLDRVTIRNVYGIYKSFGFFVTPWYGYGLGEGEGNYGSLVFENIDLVHTYHKYLYTTPFLFRLGGKIEHLTLRNIKHYALNDDRPIVEARNYFCHAVDESYVEIGTMEIDGLEVDRPADGSAAMDYITIDGQVGRLFVKNVSAVRKDTDNPDTLLHILPNGKVDTLVMQDVLVDGVKVLVNDSKQPRRCYKDRIYEG